MGKYAKPVDIYELVHYTGLIWIYSVCLTLTIYQGKPIATIVMQSSNITAEGKGGVICFFFVKFHEHTQNCFSKIPFPQQLPTLFYFYVFMASIAKNPGIGLCSYILHSTSILQCGDIRIRSNISRTLLIREDTSMFFNFAFSILVITS